MRQGISPPSTNGLYCLVLIRLILPLYLFLHLLIRLLISHTRRYLHKYLQNYLHPLQISPFSSGPTSFPFAIIQVFKNRLFKYHIWEQFSCNLVAASSAIWSGPQSKRQAIQLRIIVWVQPVTMHFRLNSLPSGIVRGGMQFSTLLSECFKSNLPNFNLVSLNLSQSNQVNSDGDWGLSCDDAFLPQ